MGKYNITKKQLVRFLKENNCYQQFMKELELTNNLFDNDYPIDYIIDKCNEKKINVFKYAILPTKRTVNLWDNMAKKWEYERY